MEPGPTRHRGQHRVVVAIGGAAAFTLAAVLATIEFGPPLAGVLDVGLPSLLALLWCLRGRECLDRGGPLAPLGSILVLSGVALDLVPGAMSIPLWVETSSFAKVGGVALLAIVADRCRRSGADEAGSRRSTLDALDLLSEPLLGVDSEGCVVFQSRAARPLVGRDAARARMPLAEILSLEGIDVGAALNSHSDAPGGFCCHGRVLGPRSRDVIVTVHGGRDFTTASGIPLAAVVQLVDVPTTLLGRPQADQTPSSFVRQLARIAHELNNPLTALCGASALLESGGAESSAPPRDPLVSGIVRNAERCRGIVRRVLSLVKGEKAGGAEVELNRLVEQFSEDFHDVFSDRDVRLRIQPADHPCVVWSNRAGLEEVLINLVSNACSAMAGKNGGRGGGTVQVTVRPASAADGSGGMAGFDVEDDGPGIPDEVRSRVFDEFVSGRSDGLGLGLAICREVVQDSGGSIEAEPRVPNGTRIRVRLPTTPPKPSRKINAEFGARAPERRLRVLAVDDEPVLRLVIERFLTAAGHDVAVVDGGVAAHERLLAEDFDVIVSDRAMDDLDGDSLYLRVIAARPEYRGRFVFLSGSTLDRLPDAAREHGCLFVAKPFEKAELIRAVESLAMEADDATPR